MTKKFLFFIYLSVTVLILTFFMTFSTSCVQRERIIKIGSQNVLTGDFKYYGQDQLVSMNLAASEIAPVRVGGFDYKISIISRDDEGDAEKAFLVSQELVQEGVSGVIGSAFNATTKAAIPNYLEYSIPIITASAPGTDLNKAGSNFFRVIINNDQIVNNVSNFIVDELKPLKIVLIDYICQTGVSFFHFESKVEASSAVRECKGRTKLIGNINNSLTLLFKRPSDVREQVLHAIKSGIDIIGPECAVPLTTPLENLIEIAVSVKDYKECRLQE